MKAQELRKLYLDFFQSKQHTVIPPASLIPENDPTLLFVNSGMFPLMPYLSGEKHPAGKRLCDIQPSFRSVDIDSVGDKRHDTLFEMLGNWSLGDYGKREQLFWWYEFLVEVLKLDIHKLYQSVYAGDGASVAKDHEAIVILKEIFEKYGIHDLIEGPETLGRGELGPGKEISFQGNQRVFSYRDKNWWQRGDAVGELGGPDSETFYDTGKPHDPKYGAHCHINCECGRFVEIGNSVFMEYRKTTSGWESLEQKNIDFGGGLERILMVQDNANTIFETDVFQPLIQKCEELSHKKYADDTRAFEIVCDHVRAAVFLIADGAFPSNKDQGYYVRRLLRRAVQYADALDIEKHLLKELAQTVIDRMGVFYHHLESQQDRILKAIETEEEKFRKTLTKGLAYFEQYMKRSQFTVKEAFDLFSTYGFPFEMTEELARDRGIILHKKDFETAMRVHQDLSRSGASQKFKGGLADQSEQVTKFHTATHLLLQSLRQVLGDHVAQKGANITGERIRFDFSHPEKLSPEQLQSVEALVNEKIQDDLAVSFQETTLEEARKMGAMGVFGDRYGERVKIYTIGDFSKEICGGPHVERTGSLGRFQIIKQGSVAAGVRRVKAVLRD